MIKSCYLSVFDSDEDIQLILINQPESWLISLISAGYVIFDKK